MARPKGSKNKPKNAVVESTVKKPRGRPRKTDILVKSLPNTDMEEFDNNDKPVKINYIPEIEDDIPTVDLFSTRRWTSDEWNGGGFDNFSISSDYMY
jgi:hypothetical protein